MSRTKKAALVLLVLVGSPMGLILFRPDLVLSTLAKPVLADLGYEISSLQVIHLGARSTAIDSLVLVSADQRIEISRVHAQYSLAELFSGKVNSVSIDKIELLTQSGYSSANDETSTLASLLDSFDALPIDVLYLPNIELHSSDNSYEIGLGLQSPPLHIAGEAEFAIAPDILFEFDVQVSEGRSLVIESRALLAETEAADFEFEMFVEETGIAVTADGTLAIAELTTQLEDSLPSATRILNETISVHGNFQLQELFGDPSIDALSLDLDTPNSQLQIIQESDLGTSLTQLRLPIGIQGNLATGTGQLQLLLSEIYGSGEWTQDEAAAKSEHRFTDTQLRCNSFTDCDLRSDWQSTLTSWQFGDYRGEDAQASGLMEFSYSNEEMRLSANLVEISISSLAQLPDSIVSRFSTSLQLEEMELRVGDVISGGFNFTSNEVVIDSTVADISELAYSGKMQLESETLTGILEIDVEQRLRLGIGLQHFFLRDTGDVVLELAEHEFTEAEPLSSLITVKQQDADIVAGKIAGLANISWSKQQDESWRFGGPVALKLDRLSGYYEDYLFVDLSTDLFGEATTPLGITVSNPASASLSRIDIGLPLENLSWNYQFDTLSNEIQIGDFETELLGGKMSIPAARYNPERGRQQVNVVLADLRVDALLNLADYPALQADGLLSGYLPMILEGDTLSIEEGLVGALKPGGTIRYTPSVSTPSSNQSVQLVNDALSNYHYQTMNTEVFYSETGELRLAVQLHGSNPDMNNGQAINLNLNITDNIPSLLRSLQASRIITDELERFVNRP
jgi:Dicarboxylate transport